MATTPPVATGVVPGVVAFTDIVGFTEFTAIQGDEQALRLLDRHEELLGCVLPPEARIVKNLGDGFLVWFPEPRPAVDALVRFQERLEDDDDTWLLTVRVGAHFGAPLDRHGDLVGHDVNVASRILDVAGPGEVLVSEPLVDAAGGTWIPGGLTELGPVSMKGIPEPVRLYRVSRGR